ncbi:hypothetical protein M427DRAFT_433807 [Gonapodya prolifera JEL478]|uniref:Uncharacterized protein n=1 Tax=Gonapodya prolifera (strain JEL478) TaxID=1344416 RepID=A0A139ATA2_GONPJ|nr:hypothetical protein M427DRAFT_433807 [Gonapodya prolifera JEL478]|eukprot:KXS19952.1 hypothetical protein M427DRAFT_433807 [Gonapodya prolifera JEL478]
MRHCNGVFERRINFNQCLLCGTTTSFMFCDEDDEAFSVRASDIALSTGILTEEIRSSHWRSRVSETLFYYLLAWEVAVERFASHWLEKEFTDSVCSPRLNPTAFDNAVMQIVTILEHTRDEFQMRQMNGAWHGLLLEIRATELARKWELFQRRAEFPSWCPAPPPNPPPGFACPLECENGMSWARWPTKFKQFCQLGDITFDECREWWIAFHERKREKAQQTASVSTN